MSVSHSTPPFDEVSHKEAVPVVATTPAACTAAPVVKQWVDWIPQENNSQDEDDTKLTSLDVTESHWTTESVPDEDWHSVAHEDSDDMMVVVPHALLIENDPALQHELLLEDQYQSENANAQNADGNVVTDVQTQQRLLYQRMKASWQTRRMLRPHIQQRASLAKVLKSIEDSSVTLNRHVLAGARSSATNTPKPEKMAPTAPTKDEKVSSPDNINSNSNNNDDDQDDDDMMICDDPNDQEMLVSALTQDYDDADDNEPSDELEGLDDGVVTNSKRHNDNIVNEEDIKYTYVRNHHDNDDITMMMIAEDDLPEPPELTAEDIDKVDFFWLIRNEQENSFHR